MVQSIFDVCSYSIATVRKLYIGARQLNGNPIDFPLEYTTITGTSDSIIRVNAWSAAAYTATIGSQVIEWTQVPNTGDNITFEEVYEEGKQGKTYIKNLSFRLPLVNFNTNAVLKSLIFSSAGEFAISNAIAFIIDSNGQQWIVGYDLPLVLQDGFEIGIADENFYNLSFRSLSYSRVRNYQVLA
jgi:hypothetical protein